MKNNIHYLGIRHHGPGSSRLLLSALEELRPSVVLIEGPSDCNHLIPLLVEQETHPPVAILSYDVSNPDVCIFYPFAEYSPEYQASLWSIKNQAEVAFIDLPTNILLTSEFQSLSEDNRSENVAADCPNNTSVEEHGKTLSLQLQQQLNDPIGILAGLAGYEDGESWWNDLIEQQQDSDLRLFDTIAQSLGELREHISLLQETTEDELFREAYMRLQISQFSRKQSGPIVVITGAWHTSALKQNHSTSDDKALLKNLPKKLLKSQIKSTLVPWTTPRLSNYSGYGAGVIAPMWYQHLWSYSQRHDLVDAWIAHIAQLLRNEGQLISTASVIEAVRLSNALAAIKNRCIPNFEEICDAVLSSMCFAQRQDFNKIKANLMLGHGVGAVTKLAPLIPLLEDLQVQQKKLRLKSEAILRDLSLDLRTSTGLSKSILLHRLLLLDVPWGKLKSTASSLGTFREKWSLIWHPQFAVSLIDSLTYGITIEQAANNKVIELAQKEQQLPQLAALTLKALDGDLQQALSVCFERLSQCAVQTNDIKHILESLPALINITRYGSARDLDKTEINRLVERFVIQASLELPLAVQGVDVNEAQTLGQLLFSAQESIELASLSESVRDCWWSGLWSIIHNMTSHSQIVGLCAYIWFRSGRFKENELSHLFQQKLSLTNEVQVTAEFFEGFFSKAAHILRYEQNLIDLVNQWILQLEEAHFIACLPLLRRVFMYLDQFERQYLLKALLSKNDTMSQDNAANNLNNNNLMPEWDQQLFNIGQLFQGPSV